MAIEDIRSGLANLRAANIEQKKVQKRLDFGEKVLGKVTDVAGVLRAESEASDTAWDEYQKGYEELGGETSKLSRPSKFKQTLQALIPGGKKGFFDRPEGQVRIGNRLYDARQISELGAFKSTLGTPEGMMIKAAFGDKDPIEQYKGVMDEGYVKGKRKDFDYSTLRDSDISVEASDKAYYEQQAAEQAAEERTKGIHDWSQQTIREKWEDRGASLDLGVGIDPNLKDSEDFNLGRSLVAARDSDDQIPGLVRTQMDRGLMEHGLEMKGRLDERGLDIDTMYDVSGAERQSLLDQYNKEGRKGLFGLGGRSRSEASDYDDYLERTMGPLADRPAGAVGGMSPEDFRVGDEYYADIVSRAQATPYLEADVGVSTDVARRNLQHEAVTTQHPTSRHTTTYDWGLMTDHPYSDKSPGVNVGRSLMGSEVDPLLDKSKTDQFFQDVQTGRYEDALKQAKLRDIKSDESLDFDYNTIETYKETWGTPDGASDTGVGELYDPYARYTDTSETSNLDEGKLGDGYQHSLLDIKNMKDYEQSLWEQKIFGDDY